MRKVFFFFCLLFCALKCVLTPRTPVLACNKLSYTEPQKNKEILPSLAAQCQISVSPPKKLQKNSRCF